MNSANYNPQEMWNSGCQLGKWELLGTLWGDGVLGCVVSVWFPGQWVASAVKGLHGLPESRKMHFVDSI
jgi:hypothetical protein